MKKTRQSYIDVVKIIAIFLVMFNHTSTNGFMLFTIRRESILYPLYLFASVVCKVNVPLFFMASGSLLLGKEEEFSYVIKHRFLKYLLSTIIFSAVMYIFFCVWVNHEQMNIYSFLKGLLTGTIHVPYWFLYSYMSYILVLPLLRKLVLNMKNEDYNIIFILYSIKQVLSIVVYIILGDEYSLNNSFFLFYELDYIFYTLIGYYCSKINISKEKMNKMVLLSLFSIAITMILTHTRSVTLDAWNESNCQKFYGVLAFLPSITMFCLFKKMINQATISIQVERALAYIGNSTFGIYLIEVILRKVTKPIFILLSGYLGSLFSCFIWLLCAFLLGIIIVNILKKIPVLCKLL